MPLNHFYFQHQVYHHSFFNKQNVGGKRETKCLLSFSCMLRSAASQPPRRTVLAPLGGLWPLARWHCCRWRASRPLSQPRRLLSCRTSSGRCHLPTRAPCPTPLPSPCGLAELTAALDCRPTYNLSRATVIQTCQKPGTSLDYIRDYGIVSYDWSNNAATWVRPRPGADAAGLRLA